MTKFNVGRKRWIWKKKVPTKKFFENCGQAKEKCEIRDIIDRISNAGESEKSEYPVQQENRKKEKMSDNEIIISGQNLDLTDALKESVTSKMQKLFVHDERIIRLRVELAYKPNKHHHNEFSAKGHLEIQGPDMIVSVASDDMYKSIDELLVKLARKIRRRHRLERIKRKDDSTVKFRQSA